jgi:starvation-inducible outer membrane lipoprotein
MKKIILIIAFSFVLVSCASVTDKIPKIERKSCDGSDKTLADVLCKKN